MATVTNVRLLYKSYRDFFNQITQSEQAFVVSVISLH